MKPPEAPVTLAGPLGRARDGDHCDRWHTSLGRLIKVLAVLCHWVNARLGTLDSFPISDQPDYVSAAEISLNLFFFLFSFTNWTLSDPLGLWSCRKDLLFLRNPQNKTLISLCNEVHWSANWATTTTTITSTYCKKPAQTFLCFPLSPVSQSEASSYYYLLSTGPADFLERQMSCRKVPALLAASMISADTEPLPAQFR